MQFQMFFVDSLDVGYKTLRDLVMEYAGITPNSLVQSTDSIAPSDKEGHSMAHTSADYEAMPMSAVVSGTSSTKTGTLAATEEDSTVVSSVVQETSSGGVVGGLPGTETLDLQSPLLLQNIKQVAKTWSRPSTSLSQYSGTNQSKSRIKSEVRTCVESVLHQKICLSSVSSEATSSQWVKKP